MFLRWILYVVKYCLGLGIVSRCCCIFIAIINSGSFVWVAWCLFCIIAYDELSTSRILNCSESPTLNLILRKKHHHAIMQNLFLKFMTIFCIRKCFLALIRKFYVQNTLMWKSYFSPDSRAMIQLFSCDADISVIFL